MAGLDRRAARRHRPTNRIEITCTPAGRTRWSRRRVNAVDATVVEVSADGMLMELPLEMSADPGDIVALSSGSNSDAVARVVHVVRDENWEHQWVGVEITEMSPEFTASINLLVTSLVYDKTPVTPNRPEESAW